MTRWHNIEQSARCYGGWTHIISNARASGFVSRTNDENGELLWFSGCFSMGDITEHRQFDSADDAASWVTSQFGCERAGYQLVAAWEGAT
jgi:hypothetical protein